MANIESAKKRNRQAIKNNLRNRAGKSVIKTQIKKVHAVTAAGDKAASQTEFRVAVKKIDQMAAKGIIHKNKASRLKSRLVKNVKKLAAPAK